MITDYDIQGVEFMAFNTDAQSLKMSQAPVTLQLGEELTRGLGVGGNAELGAQAAEESLDQIQELLDGANMVLLLQVWVVEQEQVRLQLLQELPEI